MRFWVSFYTRFDFNITVFSKPQEMDTVPDIFTKYHASAFMFFETSLPSQYVQECRWQIHLCWSDQCVDRQKLLPLKPLFLQWCGQLQTQQSLCRTSQFLQKQLIEIAWLDLLSARTKWCIVFRNDFILSLLVKLNFGELNIVLTACAQGVWKKVTNRYLETRQHNLFMLLKTSVSEIVCFVKKNLFVTSKAWQEILILLPVLVEVKEQKRNILFLVTMKKFTSIMLLYASQAAKNLSLILLDYAIAQVLDGIVFILASIEDILKYLFCLYSEFMGLKWRAPTTNIFICSWVNIFSDFPPNEIKVIIFCSPI